MPVIYSAKPVSIRRGDRSYNASYRREGGMVHVDSAYGSDAAKVGRRQPKAVAEEILDRIVAKSALTRWKIAAA